MIVITGATKGIGRATAERCAQAGLPVLAIARNQDDLSEMHTAWKQFPQSELFTVKADLSTMAGVQTVADFITRNQQLSVTTLVNNVGLFWAGSLLDPTTDDRLEELLNINLLAAHRLTRALLPAMLEAGAGHLVTIGSVAALDFPHHMAAYTVSKYALHGWHHALATELARTPIKTTIIIPGATLTAAWDGQAHDPERILPPSQVADAVWYALTAPANTRIESLTLRPGN